MKQESREYDGDLAEFYDWRMEGRDEDIPFYVELAKEAGDPVLELGCGTGRVTLPITEAGIEAVGLDLSGAMLDIARQKLSRMSADVQERTRFVEGNMANFSLERQFSLVILPNNQFRELLTAKDQKSCLHCVRSHLKEGGRVVVEIINPFLAIEHSAVGKRLHRKVGYFPERKAIVKCLFETTSRNLVEQWIEYNTIYVEHRKDGSEVRHAGAGRLRYIFPKELELLLATSGFEMIDKWGGYDRSRLEDESPYIIVRARAKVA